MKTMKKTRKKAKAKVRDLRARKQVKGGAKRGPSRPADPCCGGEVTRP